jgi:Skp family chaperone for outer membrane proteins
MSKYTRGKSKRQNTRQETHRDEANTLRSIINKQQKEIQVLRKELNRKYDKMSIETQDIVEEAPSNKTQKQCKSCGSKKLQTIDLGIRTLFKCFDCNHVKTEVKK